MILRLILLSLCFAISGESRPEFYQDMIRAAEGAQTGLEVKELIGAGSAEIVDRLVDVTLQPAVETAVKNATEIAGKVANRNAMIMRNRRLGKEFEAHIGKLFDGAQIEKQVLFKNGVRQKTVSEGCSVVDFLVHTEDGMIAIEAKRPIVPTKRNLYRMANRTGEQVLKADKNLPKGIKQRVWIDNRTQGIGPEVRDLVTDKIIKNAENVISDTDVFFVRG